MAEFTSLFSLILAAGSLVILLVTIALVLAEALPYRHTGLASSRVLGSSIYPIGLVVTLGLAIATLTYSEVIGFPPCELCWYQRIALYPQIVLYAVGLWQPARSLLLSALLLSGAGVVIAIYNIFIQIGGADNVFCLEGAESCSTIYVTEFGFITIPVMSLIGFVFLSVISLVAYREQGRRIRS